MRSQRRGGNSYSRFNCSRTFVNIWPSLFLPEYVSPRLRQTMHLPVQFNHEETTVRLRIEQLENERRKRLHGRLSI
jgi:hypothetical protein